MKKLKIHTHKKVVLVGTYWTGQFSKWRGYYNYPIDDDFDADSEACNAISELWLFKGIQRPLYRTAKFIGIKTKKELISEYKYKPQKGSRHKRYLLFKTDVLMSPSKAADKVIIRLSDFAKRSHKIWLQLKTYLESPDRNNPKLAKRLPKILISIPSKRICVWCAERKRDTLSKTLYGPIINQVEATIDPDFKRDVQESEIPADVLEMLLKDQTTGNNILWMTDNYIKYESLFNEKMGPGDQILAKEVNQVGNKIIRPRVDKSREEQRARVVGKAEVFTPSWICNNMINMVDAAWFGLKESPFTTEGSRDSGWERIPEKVTFPKRLNQSWLDFVNDRRLEMCCGEAPFLVSRYDATTGEVIPIPDRIGILDRKLRIVTENVGTQPDKWLKYAVLALKATLGFEWQGDNLLIARENVLYTILEYYKFYCTTEPISHAKLLELANIISWNIWQMDGLKCVVPMSCHDDELRRPMPKQSELNLFEGTEPCEIDNELPLTTPCPGCKLKKPLEGIFLHNGKYCMIMDWDENKPFLYTDLIRENQEKRKSEKGPNNG